MQVTKNITLDLLETGSPVIIKAKQNDRNTRYIAAHLYVGRLDYQVPSGTEIAFRYKKPDGTAGFYDALPDNSPAITVSGNTVTVELVEQVLTVAGCVHCEINMYNAASEKLTTFTFEISVEESVLTGAEIISSDYYNLLTSEIAKALQAVTDATEQAENAAQSAQDAADSAAMSKDWAAGQPVTYSGAPVSIAYAGAQRIAAITAYGENAQGGTTETPVPLTGISSVTVNDDVTELPIPRPLRRVGDVRDVCVTRQEYEGTEKLVVTYNVGFVELDGTEAWRISVNKQKELIMSNFVSATTKEKQFCSHAAFEFNLSGAGFYIYENKLVFGANYTGKQLSLDEFKAYLAAQKAAGTPVQVAYQLAAPETYATDPLDIDNAAGPLTVMTGGEVEVRMTELVGMRSDVSNNTVAFSEASQDADITSGEKLSVLFGKIKKRFSVLASTVMLKSVFTQVGNPNLLDNSDFTNPVNQRGVSGTISTAGYFIDRWKLISGTVQITENGLVLNGTMSQILENAAGTDVTASASAGTASYDNSTKTFTLTATGQTITWAKLEKGSVATPYVPKGYGAELAECQRYFKRVGNRGFRGWATNETNVVCCLTLATQMRVKPTITPVGTLTAYDEVSSVTVTMDSSTGSTVDTARITAHGTGLTAFRPYSLLGNVDISADL